VNRHVAPGHEGHADEAATRANQARQKSNHRARADQTCRAWYRAGRCRLFIQKHLRGRKTHKQGENQGQRRTLQNCKYPHARNTSAQNNARRQPFDQIPTDRATPVMRAQAGQEVKTMVAIDVAIAILMASSGSAP